MPATASGWRAEIVSAPGPATAIETIGGEIRIGIADQWYRPAGDPLRLERAAPPERPAAPAGALPDARVATGRTTIARTWLAEPTRRYDHGVLGDAIEAGSLVIDRRDGTRGVLRLASDAVFEDIEPRIVELDAAERIIVVKSYLDRGSALAIVDPASATIIAETPPIGRPHAWLNPAGVGDFDGDGATEIAFVRQPHVVGALEVWSWRNGQLRKAAEIGGLSNHFIGSRALGMSAVADFDGDGRPDLALPSLDRRSLRLIAFAPSLRDIAHIPLPARVATNIGLLILGGRPALLAGLDDGRLVVVRPEA